MNAFEFYQEHSYDIPTLLSIDNFIKRNHISGNDIVNVLRKANDVINLNQRISNLKAEMDETNGRELSLNQNTKKIHYYLH